MRSMSGNDRRTVILRQINSMLKACRDLSAETDYADEGYVSACLRDAETALDLAAKRLKGESTLTA